MIENLKNEHNQAKDAKLSVNIRSWTATNSPKHSSKYLKDNMKNQTIFELYTDDNKSKYSSNPMNILKSAKKISISTPSALLPHSLSNHFHFHFHSQ